MHGATGSVTIWANELLLAHVFNVYNTGDKWTDGLHDRMNVKPQVMAIYMCCVTLVIMLQAVLSKLV